jgi:hypothetical protein
LLYVPEYFWWGWGLMLGGHSYYSESSLGLIKNLGQ